MLRFPARLLRRGALKLLQRTFSLEVVENLQCPNPSPRPTLETPRSRAYNVSRHVYRYGLAGLDLAYRTYAGSGIWLSEPVSFDRPVRAVSLVTQSEKGGGIIEYDVSPSPGVWLPILPLGESLAEERLFFEVDDWGDFRARLRFTPNGPVEVRQNGKPLPSTYYRVNSDDQVILPVLRRRASIQPTTGQPKQLT